MRSALSVAFAFLLPGLGHFWLGLRRRGLVFFGLVGFTFATGLALDGGLDTPLPGGPGAGSSVVSGTTMAATGLLYAGARAAGLGGGDVRSVTYEYGRAYLLCAGTMNALLVVNVVERLRRARKGRE